MYTRSVESYAPNSMALDVRNLATLVDSHHKLERYEQNVGQFGQDTNEILCIQSLLAKTLLIESTLEEIRQIDEKMGAYVKLIDDYYPRLTEIIDKLGELDDITAIHDDIVKVQKPYIDAKVQEANQTLTEIKQIDTRLNELMVQFNKDTEAKIDLIKSYTLSSTYMFFENTTPSTDGVTLDVTDGSVLKYTLGAAEVPVNFNAIPPETQSVARQLTVIFEQGTGANKVKWPAHVKWSQDREPVLSLEKGRMDVVTLLTYNKGVTWLGFFNGGWFK